MIKHAKKLAMAAAVACAAALPGVASADLFMNNWYLDLDKDGNKVQISEYLDFVGNSYIQLTPTGVSTFSFDDNGFFIVAGADGTGPGSHNNDGSGSAFATEMTALFANGSGTGTFGGGISFTGGTLTLYSDGAPNYATSTGIYGANDGTPIGTFTLTTGSGLVNASGVPNGELTLIFRATALAAGYWFAPDGTTDLSTMVSDGLLFGFVTTNASYVANPSALVDVELAELVSETSPLVNDPASGSFIVSNNGQYRLQTVPEPGVVALLGLGLVGAYAARRRSRPA